MVFVMGKVVNGLDQEQISNLVEHVKEQPQVAQAKFYATTIWKTGLHNEVSIKDFSAGGVKNTTSRAQPFIIAGDHPPELLGTNKGASSVEVLLAALGICIASGFATFGSHVGISMDSLRIELGMLGLPEPGKVRPGFQEIRAKYYVKSKAPRDQLEKLAKMAEDLSPTKDSLRAVKFTSQLIAS
jgi:uncharacterized OsmC-like protein